MKKLAIVISMMLLVPALCLANNTDWTALEAEMKTLVELDKLLNEAWDANEAEGQRLEAEHATLLKRKEDLEWSEKKVNEEASKWSVKVANFEAGVAELTAKISTHNARCGGTYEDESYVNACNAAAERLNDEVADSDNFKNYLNAERDRINELIAGQEEAWAVHNANVDRWERQMKGYEKARKELIDAGLTIRTRMEEIMTIVNDCQAAIDAYDASKSPMTDGTMENMKAKCGNMFDNNI